MIAAFVCQIPNRIYIVHGLRSESNFDFFRPLAKFIELVPCLLSTKTICSSPSVTKELSNSYKSIGGNCSKISFLGEGGVVGINISRFSPKEKGSTDVQLIRQSLSIPADSIVVGFVGRLTPDKGILDLIESSRILHQRSINIALLLIGDEDPNDPLTPVQRRLLRSTPCVYQVAFSTSIEVFYQTMDIFCLPSFREGMPTVVLEAQACGIPVITTLSTGCRDSLPEEVRQYLISPGDATQIANTIEHFKDSLELRERLSVLGQKWVRENFSKEIVEQRFLADIVASLRRLSF
jgi:glycosyltransferase involved in cell wall biosynthesis